MDLIAHIDELPPAIADHVANVTDNLQLVADMGYGDVALAVPQGGALVVLADARPNTAVAPYAATRVGQTLDPDDEPEAYEALRAGHPVFGERRRVVRGIKYTTMAYPLGGSEVYAVVIRDLADQVVESPGKMETEFMDAAEELLDSMRLEPLRDVRTGAPFATHRSAGDGVLRVNSGGTVKYASPNAVNIMRLAGAEGSLVGVPAAELPGGGYGIAPVLGGQGAIAIDVQVGERSMRYRTISLPAGALVLIEDVTETLRREAEIKVKEATIREVHHRVKNNLQTIASLLRIQARRSDSEEVRHALAEAVERVSSMAVVHDLLAGSDEERIDFTEAARTVVDLVGRGLLGEDTPVVVTVDGSTGLVDAHMATSLALALAELVHNAIEHAFIDAPDGRVEVTMRRFPEELVIAVRDDGRGLAPDFDPDSSANLGLAIVRTVVHDDLRGTLTFSSGRGTTVTVRVPLDERKS